MKVWKITLGDGRTGYQVMDDFLNLIKLVDEAGKELTGGFDYSTDGIFLDPLPDVVSQEEN